jgi:hypothetical protein
MKKWMLVSIVISLVLTITACGSAQTATATATVSTTLSQEGQLLVGTIKLESTDLAVSSDQADQLLPLWETLQSLESSGTAASQEIDAVVSQIESTMSAEQLSSITAMNLTPADLAAVAADAGTSSTTSISANTTSASSAQPQASTGSPAAGAPGGGNPPADMGSGMNASTGSQAVDQTLTGAAQAVTSQSSAATYQVSPSLINTLVELLKAKVA